MRRIYLSVKQNHFSTKLAEELFQELTFLNHALAGRIEKRSDFTDKFLQLVSSIGSAAAALTTLGVALPITFVTKAGGMLVEHGGRYWRAEQQDQTTARFMQSVDASEYALRLLTQEVAQDAAYQYEYALNELIADNLSLDCFARIGALRMIDYFIRNRCTVLTKENLLTGLVQGNSGAMIYSLTNNTVVGQGNIAYTVEDLYARCAYRTSDGKIWINTDHHRAEVLQRSQRYMESKLENGVANSHFGWVKMDAAGNPLTGYRWATQAEVDALGYQPFLPKQTNIFVQRILAYLPSWRFVEKIDFENYIHAWHKGYCGSFNHYIGAAARFNQELEGMDLTGADFSDADFTDATFKNCTLNHCHFEHANLTRSIWINTKAHYLRAAHARCTYMQAPGISFQHSDFKEANAYQANFERADLTHCELPTLKDVVDHGMGRGGEYSPSARHIVDFYEISATNAEQPALYIGACLRAVIVKYYQAPTALQRNSPPFSYTDCAILMFGNLSQNNIVQYAIVVKEGIVLATNLMADIALALNQAVVGLQAKFKLSIAFQRMQDSPYAINALIESFYHKTLHHQLQGTEPLYLGGNAELYTVYVDRAKIDFLKKNHGLLLELDALHAMLKSPEQLSFSYSLYQREQEKNIWTNFPLKIIPSERLFHHYWGYLIKKIHADTGQKQNILNQCKVNYKEFPQQLKQYSLATLTEVYAVNPELSEELLQHLCSVEQSDGWFYAMEVERQNWLQQLQLFFLTPSDAATRSMVRIRVPALIPFSKKITTQLSDYDLSPTITDIFLTAEGNFKHKSAGIYSLHPVYRLHAKGETKIHGWIRIYPEQPGVEFAVIQLLRRISGSSYWPQTLITRCEIPNRPPIAVQWSEHIAGVSLSDNAPWLFNYIERITQESFIAQLFADMITGPGDNTENDYFLVKTHQVNQLGQALYDLKRIDLERSFFTAEKQQTQWFISYKNVLQVQSLLLTLPQMQQPLDLTSPIMQRLLRLDIHQLLAAWVTELTATHTMYQALFSPNEFAMHFSNMAKFFTQEEQCYLFANQSQPQFSFLTIPIGGALVKELHARLTLLQDTVQKYYRTGESLTPMQLLKEVNPALAKYYERGFQEIPNKATVAAMSIDSTLRKTLQARFGDIANLPESISSLLRFWYLTQALREINVSCGSQRIDMSIAAVTPSLRLQQPLTLLQAQQIYKGEGALPHPQDARQALEKLSIANGQYLVDELLSATTPMTLSEQSSRVEQFQQFSSRYKKSLIKAALRERLPEFMHRHQYERLLFLMQNVPFRKLNLSPFADYLTDKMLEKLLMGSYMRDYLEELNLTNCKRITDDMVRWVSRDFKNLRTLKLDPSLEAVLQEDAMLNMVPTAATSNTSNSSTNLFSDGPLFGTHTDQARVQQNNTVDRRHEEEQHVKLLLAHFLNGTALVLDDIYTFTDSLNQVVWRADLIDTDSLSCVLMLYRYLFTALFQVKAKEAVLQDNSEALILAKLIYLQIVPQCGSEYFRYDSDVGYVVRGTFDADRSKGSLNYNFRLIDGGESYSFYIEPHKFEGGDAVFLLLSLLTKTYDMKMHSNGDDNRGFWGYHDEWDSLHSFMTHIIPYAFRSAHITFPFAPKWKLKPAIDDKSQVAFLSTQYELNVRFNAEYQSHEDSLKSFGKIFDSVTEDFHGSVTGTHYHAYLKNFYAKKIINFCVELNPLTKKLWELKRGLEGFTSERPRGAINDTIRSGDVKIILEEKNNLILALKMLILYGAFLHGYGYNRHYQYGDIFLYKIVDCLESINKFAEFYANSKKFLVSSVLAPNAPTNAGSFVSWPLFGSRANEKSAQQNNTVIDRNERLSLAKHAQKK